MTTLSQAIASGSGIERMFLCPVHGDSTPSASVNTVKMVWVCYACGAHGRVGGEDLLAEIDFVSFRRMIKKQAERAEPLPESWLKVYDAPEHPYWKSRFSESAIASFSLGFDYELECATTPLRAPDGALLGVVRRYLDRPGNRYHYPYGIDISHLLFNYHYSDKPVIVLTEGATDAVAAWDVGVQALAIYGSTLREPQAALLRRYDPQGIVCAFDMDQAGTAAYKSVLAQLPQYPISRAMWPSRMGKDLSALSVKIREDILTHELERFGRAGVASLPCTSTRN